MSSEQDFKCVFCKETFSQKEDLQIHFRKHGDPNFNQKNPLVRSPDLVDMPAEKPRDQAEVVECDVCAEVFSSISKAITHKHKMHPDHDSKYFCPWCGKLFTMKHLYNKHMQTNHSDKEKSSEKVFHCDSCDVNFNIPAAMAYHNKFYHRQEDLPALGHSKKLKMILEEIMQIYYCPFCGEEYDNKVNLHKHMSEEHISENQCPEDVFRCPLCDAIFYYLDAYELHLTYHSSEDLYTERSELMDEITDFSLETVQPLQEKVETTEPGVDGPNPIGIEELLEFTMGDGPDIRKSKKHKKHKKSKKAAITLDEFLNMNKDVFGEGIDFHGIEEVPTQVVAKRLKSKKVPTTSSDLAKLKRQGIVVKKQSKTTKKPINLKKRPPNDDVRTLNHKVQQKSSILTSTDDVLSKLLNQGSQIKIVKKTNTDTEKHLQQDEKSDEETSSVNNIEPNKEATIHSATDATKTEELSAKMNEEDVDTNNSEANIIKHTACSPNQETSDIVCRDTDLNHTPDANGSHDNLNDSSNQTQKDKNLTDNLVALRNNTNLIIKSSKQHFSEANSKKPECHESDGEDVPLANDPIIENDSESSASTEKSSFNPLRHLSHLITIKSVNSSQNMPSSGCNKPENGLQKLEVLKPLPQNNTPKKLESNNLANLKNLGNITIKSTSNTQSTPTKKYLPVEAKGNDEGDDHEEEDECGEGVSAKGIIENDPVTNKIAHLLKSPQLCVQTKHSPKTKQKLSPNLIYNNDNSQSSADLLKHLKNVTAKPVNVNTQNIPTPECSPSSLKRSTLSKAAVPPKEITEDGIEVFNIEDSDSDDANSQITTKKSKPQTVIKNENTTVTNKSIDALKHINKNITVKSNNQQNKTVKNESSNHTSKEFDEEDDDWGDDHDEKDTRTSPINSKINVPKPNQKNIALNNVLKNLRKNITVKSRNSSPSHLFPYQDNISKNSHLETNEGDSDSDSPSSRVKITEMANSDDEFPKEAVESDSQTLVKVQHPDDSHSEHEDEHMDEDFDDDMSDIESQIEAAKLLKHNSKPSSNLESLKHLNKNLTVKPTVNSKSEKDFPPDEIPKFAKNLSNQISIKQIKKPETNTIDKTAVQTASHSMNQSSMNQKIASTSNQLNTFNKEVKTVKTFQTQTKTVIQEITTTVTKTIKTVNQTTKQEVRNMAQSISTPMIPQKIQGTMKATFPQKNFQGVKVRQAPPNVRPKIRGQAPQMTRPVMCAPPQVTRPAICPPVRASNQLVPVRPALNRPSGPRPRLPNAINVRASTSGQPRPRAGRPVKVSPGAIYSSNKKPAEAPGHFSCFKKPKESLIPEPDFPLINQNDGDMAQFSSAVQMSKCNFSSTSKIVKGNSVVTSTQTKSEMTASSQQLSKLRNMSGLSVVKTSQNQAKQTHVEEKSEMSVSNRNALSAIQKLQSQGLLVKKPRLDYSEESDHSQPGSDDMGHNSNEEFDD